MLKTETGTRPAHVLFSTCQHFGISVFNFPGTCVIQAATAAHYKFNNSFERTLHGGGRFFCERLAHRLPGEDHHRGDVEQEDSNAPEGSNEELR